MKKGYLPQVDLVKGLAIIAILLLHFIAATKTQVPWAVLALLQTSVPVFVAVMAFNMARSSELKPRGIWQYFKGRAKRLLPAFFLAFAVTLLLGIFLGISLDFGERQLVGYFPVPGPGNYFIPLVFQFVILFPLLFKAFKKSKALSFAAFFGIDIAFEAANLWGIAPVQVVYSYCILRFMALVWIGFFTAEKALSWKASAIAERLPLNILGLLGRASYHIFITQIILFSDVGSALGFNAIQKVLVSLAIGLVAFNADSRIFSKSKQRREVKME